MRDGFSPGSWPGRGIFSVSGGGDSVAMLLLAPEHVVKRSLVVNFDHGLRSESGAEARFVHQLASRVGAAFRLVHRSEPFPKNRSIQGPARVWRRSTLERLRQENSFDWIYTGHTLDDWRETVYQQVLRGRGIQNCRGFDRQSGPWIKPLRGISRRQLRCFLDRRGESWLEDASNLLPVYQRNSLRLIQLPAMREREDIDRWLDIRGEVAGRIYNQAQQWLRRHTRGSPEHTCSIVVQSLAPALLPAVLALWIDCRGLRLNRPQIEACLQNRHTIRIGGGWLWRYGTRLWTLSDHELEHLSHDRDPACSPDLRFRNLLLDKRAKVLNITTERGYPNGGRFPGSGSRQAKKLFRRNQIPAAVRSCVLWYYDREQDRIVMEFGSRNTESVLYLLP